MLRMFNDGVAMLLAYVAIWLLTKRYWRASLVMFSAAVSVKMNILLMAPAVLIILLKVSLSPLSAILPSFLAQKLETGWQTFALNRGAVNLCTLVPC